MNPSLSPNSGTAVGGRQLVPVSSVQAWTGVEYWRAHIVMFPTGWEHIPAAQQ